MSERARARGALRLAAIAAMLPAVGMAAPRAAAPRPLAKLDDEFAAAARELSRRCEIDGHADLRTIIDTWTLPPAEGRQHVFTIPSALEPPACVDTDTERTIWRDFLAARRARASETYELARHAANAHARRPTRAEAASPAPDPPPLDQASCEAVRLLFLALRDDPDHAQARAAAGWVRRDGRWEWPEAARRLDRAEEYDPAFGWMAKGKLARHRAGERSFRGRWVKAADDDASLREVEHGRQFDADHWEIVSTASPDVTGELATTLEATRLVWLQVFGAFATEPTDLERRLAGRGRPAAHPPHSAILCGSRDQYLAELRLLEPRIAAADGLYWQPTATIWFFADPGRPPLETIHHEGFHQLFAESRPDLLRTRVEPGGECGFWAVEAAALYAETIREASFGWTLGGRDRGRGPAARRLRLEERVHVPLTELVALGREAFQSRDRLGDLYDQCGGLADFFMNAHGGRYREAFVEYLTRVYSGSADPDTLARLCRRSLAELDAEHEHFMR